MSQGTILAIVAIAVALSIILSIVTKINAGLYAMSFTILICFFCLGDKTVSHAYTLFPVKLLFTILSITMFFGIAMDNGAVLWIADSLIKLSKGKGKLIPFMLFAAGLVPTMMGATGYTIIAFMAPIAFAMREKIGMKMPLTIICCSAGTMAGSNFVGGYGNTILKNLVAETIYGEFAMNAAWSFFFGSFISMFTVFLVAYFIWGGYKLTDIEIDTKIEKLTYEKKGSLIAILVVLLLILIPAIINTFAPNPAVKAFSDRFDVATLMMLASVVAFLLKFAKADKVIKTRVNWATILLACGFTMILNLAQEVGVVDFLAAVVSENVAAWLVSPALSLMAGCMTFFSGAMSVVCPLIIPMVEPLVAALGLNPGQMFTAISTTACASAISPLSTSGSLFLAQVSEEKRDYCFYLQWALAAFSLGVCTILNFIGVYALISF